jgi:DNA-binding LacI/PurR family transcriptional regulator
VISLKQLAIMCGVSEATASKALSGHPGVREATREKVFKMAKRFNYQPNALVRSIQSGRTMMVGVACGHFKNMYAGMIMEGVQKTLFTNGYDMIVIPWGLDEQDGEAIFRSFAERRVDGLLVFPPDQLPTPKYIGQLRRVTCPLVLIDQTWTGCEFDFVGTQDREGAQSITEHLISLGHERIAIFYYGSVSTGGARLEGFESAMQEHGIAVHSKWLVNVKDLECDAYRQAKRIFSQKKDRPTAIVCFNDYVAMQVMSAAWDLGVNVPTEVSVAGFADLWATGEVRPKLTTVRQNGEKVGITSAELLLKRIEEERKDKSVEFTPSCVLLPTELVVRDSTAKVCVK